MSFVNFYDKEEGLGFPNSENPDEGGGLPISADHFAEICRTIPPTWVLGTPEQLKELGIRDGDTDELKAAFDKMLEARIPEEIRRFRAKADEFWKAGRSSSESEEEIFTAEDPKQQLEEWETNYWGPSGKPDGIPNCSHCVPIKLDEEDGKQIVLKEYPPVTIEAKPERPVVDLEALWAIDTEDKDFKQVEEEEKKRAERRRRNAEMSGSADKEPAEAISESSEEEMSFERPVEWKKPQEGRRREPSAWLKAKMAHKFSDASPSTNTELVDNDLPDLEDLPEALREKLKLLNENIGSMIRDKLPIPKEDLPSISDLKTYPAETQKSGPVEPTVIAGYELKEDDLMRAQASAGPKPQVALTPDEIISILPHIEVTGDRVTLMRDLGVDMMPVFESRLRDVFKANLVVRDLTTLRAKKEAKNKSNTPAKEETGTKKKYDERAHRNKAKYQSKKRGKGKDLGGLSTDEK